MQRQLGEVLTAARDQISGAWAERIQHSSERYRKRPLEELQATCASLVDAIAEAVTLGTFEAMDTCLQDIAERRAAGGFETAELQRAMLMGCDTVFPALQQAYGADARQLVWSVTQIEKVIHRSLNLLTQTLNEIRLREMEAETRTALELRQAAENRLQALLAAFGHGAVAVSPNLVVLWADERARSARCGILEPGEALACDKDSGQEDGGCLLAAASETGAVQAREPRGDCDIWLAIPLKSNTGEVSEILGIMGAGRDPAGDAA